VDKSLSGYFPFLEAFGPGQRISYLSGEFSLHCEFVRWNSLPFRSTSRYLRVCSYNAMKDNARDEVNTQEVEKPASEMAAVVTRNLNP